jgi:hypothetical protein
VSAGDTPLRNRSSRTLEPDSGGRKPGIARVLACCLLARALASRVTKTAGVVAALGVVAAVPYAVVELVAWQLAF